MADAYRRFLKTGIDLTSLGVMRGEREETYFCTPKGASVIGWAGVDGIHYCFIRGFGEMVFAVSPMNAAPDYVHPLAKDFSDFLRLLLACGDAAALEQAWMWDEEAFAKFLEENPKTAEQEKTCAELAKAMKLTAMERPWAYIKDLQASFDYSKIRYTEDFYDPEMNPAAEADLPDWKVYYDGNFWGNHGKARAGKEIPLAKRFDWAGREWRIPAIYACSRGLVIDFCMRAQAEALHAFMEKWELGWENGADKRLTREQQMQRELDNPFCLDFQPKLMLDGRELRMSHGCSVCYCPRLPDGSTGEREAEWAVEHYALDTACGWTIFRYAFPWGSTRRPALKSLSLTMVQQPASLPGPHFRADTSGSTFSFSHPANGAGYTLTVREIERQVLPQSVFGSDEWKYPTHCCTMCYTICPEIPSGRLTVEDCAEGDRPIKKEKSKPQPPYVPAAAADAGVIGFIGGADGPVVSCSGAGENENQCVACSSLHFSPAQSVEWRLVFHEKQWEDKTVNLIG